MASRLRLRLASPSPSHILTTATSTPAHDTTPTQNSAAHPQLLSYEDLPQWYRDNEPIIQGYRPVSGSVAVSFRSLLYMHNESVNIYSHLLPALIFIVSEGTVLRHLHSKYANVTTQDDIIFSFFILTAVVCLSSSACYHTLTNHSEAVDSIWLRIDFIGIIILTLGDFISGIYMVFWCEPTLRIMYWAMIATLCAVDIFILLSPRFQGPSWRTFRVLCFVGTGLSGFTPLIHGICLFGFSQMMKQSGMPYYLGEGACLALGALIYMTRFPECLKPGRFDFYGASHQLFHLLVVAATGIQLVGILDAFDYNYKHRVCLPS